MGTDKVVCDTDVIIDYFDDQQPRHAFTKIIVDTIIGIDNVLISAITKMELIAGAANKAELRSINKNIYGIELLLINIEVSSKAISLFESYKLSHNLAMPDALIAATAIVTQFPLFTYNLKDYKFIDGIELYNPAKS